MTGTRLASPIGELVITASDSGVTGVWFPGADLSGVRPDDGRQPRSSLLARACEQLTAYFVKDRKTFDLPLEPAGTAFQRRVWTALRAIPYGTTLSYGELARRLGDPRATRAVGAANGSNPIPIIVPCHRVIGARGELTGFGGGLDRKRWLLEHEGALTQRLDLPLRSPRPRTEEGDSG
ncbi:MAG TPA: methylated-DNA--[protein]-cysteine S-methyltransferase [Gemmatimonadales bacterium]|nr:methylated-DNA--[protein]-cysteine S-methyltransferase [Gemmatimonadales bacterium]